VELPETQRTPGIVVFVAILNFISASFSALGMVLALLGLAFGNALGLADALSRQLTEIQTRTNVVYGINFVFIIIFLISLSFFVFFLSIGLGLLKGKKFAWFTQVAASVLGLIGFPIWTVLNGIILYCFFQPRVRDWFKV